MSSRHDRLHVFIPHREKCLNTPQMVNINLPVLSPLGEVQKINRDGINQTDVQPVGKSSHCPKHWLLPIKHSLNLTKTFKSCMVTHAWPSKIQKSSSYCWCYFFTYYLLANVTYYWWNICSNTVLSFAHKVWRSGLIHSSLPGNDSLWPIFALLSAFVCVWVSALPELNKI